MHVRTPFPYLGNGKPDCAETWCVVREPLAMHFTKDGGYPHERTCNCRYIHSLRRIRSFSLAHRPKGVLLRVVSRMGLLIANGSPSLM